MAENQLLPSPATTLVVENWCKTSSRVIKFNFTWTIENFSFIEHKTGETISSSLFSAGDNHESKWFLQLYPKGECEDSQDYLALYLHLGSGPPNKLKVLARFNGPGVRNFLPVKTWGYKKFASRDFLLDPNNEVLSDDKLIIFCEVFALSDRENISGQKSIDQFEIPKCKLASDLSNLLENKKFSDVTLVVDKHEFSAHKTILAARSVVFAAMFDHEEMEEQKLNRVTITDVDHEVLQEMLYFIYTGIAPNLKELAADLMVAADKYDLEQLKVLCAEALFSKLKVETTAETLLLADMHCADELKEKTIDFFKSHAKEVIKTIEWKNLAKTNPNLLVEALEAMVIQNDIDNLQFCKHEKEEPSNS
ncbi:protein roadkill-like [Episyrphus balteatus]|uniref:protein roadkill-like n=1 Tax=Episyrphus balteatus TaxID=286459 RepID=UPI00248571A1|nr:protein roadkill-like [Episyrphus balteatus]